MKKEELTSKINVLYIHNRPSGGAGESLYQMIYKNSLWYTKGVIFSNSGFLRKKFNSIKPKNAIYYYNTSSWLSSVKDKKWLFWPSKAFHLLKNLSYYTKVKRLVESQKIDIIHTNTINIIEGGIVGKSKNIPHFIQVRELLDLDYYNYPISKKWIVKRLLKYSDLLIANSERTKKGLLKFKIPEKKIKVIYNAVSRSKEHHDIRDYLNLPKDTKIVVIVGWITPNKMIEDFLKVAKFFEERPNTKFLIIGDYGFDKTYNTLIEAKMNKLSNVILTGIIENVTEYMASFDLLLCTCYTESFGRTVAEALIEGTPAIGIESCAVAEIIKHKKSGFLVDKSDIESFIDYTKVLLDNKELNRSMGICGMEDVEKRFGIKTIQEQFLELYKEFKIK